MRRDVPTLLTGLVVTGFSGVVLWLALGFPLPGEARLWFAGLLLGAGTLGLMLSLWRRP